VGVQVDGSRDGSAPSIRDIGKNLGARYVIEGSVQRNTDKMRIIAQLVDASNGENVWTERYDREGSDPLSLQDDIATKVVATIAGEEGVIKLRQHQESWGKDSATLDEYSYYLRGHELLYRLTKDDTEKAIQVFEEGLRKFPSSALLKVKLGIAYWQRVYGGWTTNIDKDYSHAAEFVQAGLAEQSVSPLAKAVGHFFLAYYNMEYVKDYEKALKERDITLALGPSDPVFICSMAAISSGSGRPDDAIASVSPIKDLKSGFVWGSPDFALGRAYFVKGDYPRALEYFKDAPADAASSLPFLAASYAEVGNAEMAAKSIKEALAQIPSLSVSFLRQLFPNQNQEAVARQDKAMRKAGLPES
jgi:tetratricopeptide (TPR) repeat protein